MLDTAVTTRSEMKTKFLAIDKQMPVKLAESVESTDNMTPIETSRRLQAMDNMEAREIALDAEVVSGTSQQTSLIIQCSQHNSHFQACTLPHA